jgi:Holliday junction DNA helicase RuvA
MIARIEGILVQRDMQRVLVDVHGVGYEIEVPLTTLTGLPDPGNGVVLHTHFLVREDAQTLFGFASPRDRDLFRRLIRVTGIGARLALAMLSTMSADELAGNIAGHHVLALTRVPGIGKRTAERIVLELGERLQDMGFGSNATVTSGSETVDIERDAAAALEALGYRAADIERMLTGVRGQAERTEDLVRLALRATLRS